MNDERRHGPEGAERSALWSALLPGLGQWLAGRRRRGFLFALPALAGIGAVVWVFVEVRRNGVAGIVEVMVQPRWLWLLVVLNAVLAVERLVAVADAWRAQPRERATPAAWGWRATVAGLALLMLVPHVVVHDYALEAISLIDTVFGDQDVAPLAERERDLLAQGVAEEDLGPPATSPPTTAPPTTVPETTTTAPTTTTSYVPADPRPIVYGELAEEEVVYEPLSFGDTYTVLLAGGDFGPGRRDLRTDVMIVAHLDLVAGKVSLIGISRELTQLPLPPAWSRYNTMLQVQAWHELQAWEKEVREATEAGLEPPPPPPEEVEEPCDCYYDRINYLHVHTANWVRTFPDVPDPGMEALRQVLSHFLDLEIDSYVLVDFSGFVDLVDAIGGVEVTVTEAMNVGYSPAKEGEEPVRINVEPGVHLLDGRQALAYVRDREGSSDNERMRRQRCMIRELASQTDASTLFFEFGAIAKAIRESTTTTLPLEMLPQIIQVLGSLGPGDIATLGIGSWGYAKELNYRNLPIVDTWRVRRAVHDLLTGVSAGTTLGDAEDECDLIGP